MLNLGEVNFEDFARKTEMIWQRILILERTRCSKGLRLIYVVWRVMGIAYWLQ